MSTIHLVRHGQKLSTPGDPGLTELGRQQARETGAFLHQFPITAILTSPFARTTETADEVAAVLGMTHTTHPALAERMNWNEGTDWTDFLAEWHKATADRDYAPKYGASSRATGERIRELIRQVGSEDQHLVLVSHGGAIVDLLRTLFPDERLRELRISSELGFDFRMPHCAISTVVWGDRPLLERLASTGHLSEVTE